MWGLLLSTILTSAADSINPIAITQQFILQGLVKKPKHIWYFIVPTGITNLIGGFLAYFGLVAFVGSFFQRIVESYGFYLFAAELIVGIALLIAGGFVIQNRKINALKKQIQSTDKNEESEEEKDRKQAIRKVKSVSPLALITMGVGSTISELTTALPYFAFLAILLNYQLTLLQVTLILLVYNTIYTLPLIILYFVYIKAKNQFDALYTAIKEKMTRWSNILVPAVLWIVGVIVVYHSLTLLLK